MVNEKDIVVDKGLTKNNNEQSKFAKENEIIKNIDTNINKDLDKKESSQSPKVNESKKEENKSNDNIKDNKINLEKENKEVKENIINKDKEIINDTNEKQQTGFHLKMVNDGEEIGTLDVGSDDEEDEED